MYKFQIGLSGGVFQNKPLTKKVIQLAKKNKIEVLTHKKVPANDGGLSLGQIAFAYKLH